jgi:hypothetical protein
MCLNILNFKTYQGIQIWVKVGQKKGNIIPVTGRGGL